MVQVELVEISWQNNFQERKRLYFYWNFEMFFILKMLPFVRQKLCNKHYF